MAWLFNGFCVSLYFEYIKMLNAMTRKYLMMLAAWLLIPVAMTAQTYSALWKQVENAQEKDLPKTALSHLTKIETKARQDKAYGQLLKAALTTLKLQGDIAPDSLAPAVVRIEQQYEAAKDPVLQMVYATVLYKVYSDNPSLDNDTFDKAKHYCQLAMAKPDLLAKVKADGYEPLIERGKDSKVFNHDLLSVVALELDEWQWLYDYYMKAENCRAACIAASHIAKTVEGYDSLIALFADYAEAAELAIGRYHLMHTDKYTNADRYQWLQHALECWGTWTRADMLRNELTSLTTPCFAAA
jgi:hypothetical protein